MRVSSFNRLALFYSNSSIFRGYFFDTSYLLLSASSRLLDRLAASTALVFGVITAQVAVWAMGSIMWASILIWYSFNWSRILFFSRALSQNGRRGNYSIWIFPRFVFFRLGWLGWLIFGVLFFLLSFDLLPLLWWNVADPLRFL